MFKIQKIKKRIKDRKYLILGICLVLVFCILFLFLGGRGGNAGNFIDAYSDYRTAVERHEIATYLPGMNDNAVRQEMDQILAGALTENIKTTERLRMAKDGMALVKKSEEQIDNIGQTSVSVETAIARLEKNSAEIHSEKLRNKTDEIISTAKDELSVSSDIRGLSYRANYYISEIFKRIIADGGHLSDSHILELNRQIPETEKQFDRRTALYSRFENLTGQREKQYINFENSL